MSNSICPWSSFLSPGPRAVSGPGAAGAPKAAGWELLCEAGGSSVSQSHRQCLSCPGTARGWRCGMGPGLLWDGTVRDKTALLSLSCWLFVNGVSLSPGLTCSQGEQLWDGMLVWTRQGCSVAGLQKQGLYTRGCVRAGLCLPAAPPEPWSRDTRKGFCINNGLPSPSPPPV